MSEKQVVRLHTTSAEETMRMGEELGRRLKGGEIIELVSDLGGGKTTFTRGLAKGFGSADRVSSPTFTISQEYHAGDRTMYHFDFYRLHEAGIVANELDEVAHDPNAVVIVEWGDIVANVLPADRLSVTITAVSEQERELVFSYPASLTYLIPKGRHDYPDY